MEHIGRVDVAELLEELRPLVGNAFAQRFNSLIVREVDRSLICGNIAENVLELGLQAHHCASKGIVACLAFLGTVVHRYADKRGNPLLLIGVGRMLLFKDGEDRLGLCLGLVRIALIAQLSAPISQSRAEFEQRIKRTSVLCT